MKEEIEKLIQKYRNKISELQRQQKLYESSGKAGACISNQGEIQAYNVILLDLRQLIYPS